MIDKVSPPAFYAICTGLFFTSLFVISCILPLLRRGLGLLLL